MEQTITRGRTALRGKPLLAFAILVLIASPRAWAGEPAPAPDPNAAAPPSTAAEGGTGAAPADEKASQAEKGKEGLPRIIEKVVVSATIAEDRLSPVTFTNVPREEIEQRDRGQDLAMILADTPNAYAYSDAGNGVGYSYLSVRGFDQHRISVLINGVPLNTPETHQVYYIDLADFAGGLERIQLQRGTGASLYGPPAVGGVVNLETQHLATLPGGEFKLGFGSFGTWRTDLRYGGPLAGGRWAWTARVSHVASDGYRIPSWTRHTLLQTGLERYGENSVLRILLFGGPERTQLAYLGVPIEYLRGEITGNADHDRRINPLRPGETDSFLQPQLQILHDLRLTPRLFLENTGYVIIGDGYYRQFADEWQKRWIGSDQFGWIPRVTWDHRGGTLAAGAELQYYDGRHRGTVIENAEGQPISPATLLYDYRNIKKTYSAFVRETLRPSPALAVNLEIQGTRHAFEMRDDRTRGISFDANYSFLVPRVGVNWNFTGHFNLYATASAARSEPTFRNVWDPEDPYALPSDYFRRFDPARDRYSDPVARPERLRDYELGFGYLAGATRVKLTAYRMDFRDEFVFAGGIDNDGNPITKNAGRSLHQGVELEATARIPGKVELSGYLSASRDELRDFRLFGQTAEGTPFVVDYSGNRIALFPDFMARLKVARRFGPARIIVGLRRVGTIYLDNSENERKNPAARDVPGYVDKKIDPYTLVDLLATIDLGRYTRPTRGSLRLDLQVDNLLDERFVAFGYSYPSTDFTQFYTEFIPGATRSLFFGVTYGF